MPGQGGDTALRISLLGPTRVVTHAGQHLPVTSRLQRAVLAYLALHAGQVVPAHRLIDAIWGDQAPETAAAALHVHISGLRKALGPAAHLLETRTPGYLMAVSEDDVDVLALERGLKSGQNLDGLLTDLTRSQDVLSDLTGVPFAESVATHVDQLRWAWHEEMLESALANGSHAEVIAEAQELVRIQPYRERLWRSLIVGLYRADRQAEALAAYRKVADLLASELGLDPGPALQAVHHAVLVNDPVLLAPPRPDQRLPQVPRRHGPLVGRRLELEQLRVALASHRVVTVTGPGGVGKTALVQEAASLLSHESDVEVTFLDLALITDPTAVIAAVGRHLGSPESAQADGDAAERIGAYLGSRRVTLVLDTMEHLTAAGPSLSRLVNSADGLTLLITSRSSLDLATEHVVALGPLDDAAASELFVNRAGAPRTANAADGSIAALCARLDGIPLAIELAAARCRSMEPHDLLSRLDGRLSQLGGAIRDRPARHRTMQATIEWSVDLLTPYAKRIFCRAGATAGTLHLDDLLDVVRDQEMDEAEALQALDSLVDASLIQVAAGRYRMLDMVGSYAIDLLEQTGDLVAVRRRHVDWAIARCAAAAVALAGPDEDRAVADLGEVLDDLQLAAIIACDHGWHDDSARILVGGRRAWFAAGRLLDMKRLLDGALAGDLAPSVEAVATGLLAILRKITGDAGIDELDQAALKLRETGSSPDMLVNVLCHEAALMAESEQEVAKSVAAEALDVARRNGSPGDVAMALDLSGYVARVLGDDALAVELAQESVAAAGGNGSQLALGLAGLCASLSRAARPREALQRGVEAIRRADDLGVPWVVAEVVGIVTEAVGPAVGNVFAGKMAESVAVCVAYGNRQSAGEVCRLLAEVAGPLHLPEAIKLDAAADRMTRRQEPSAQSEAWLERVEETEWAVLRAEGAVLDDDQVVRLAQEVAELVSEDGSPARRPTTADRADPLGVRADLTDR